MVNMGELFAHRRIGDVPMELVPMSEKEKAKYMLRNGDLLFARQSLKLEGAGQCSIVVGESDTRTFEGHLIRCRLAPQKVLPNFYFYLFESPQGKALIRSIVEQVAAAGIRGSDLKKLRVPIPPLPEQRRIAAVLGALDDKIELNRKMNKTLEEMAQAIFKSWFIDFDGHTDLVDSELGPIPSGWEVKEIQKTVDVVGGGTPRTKEPAFWDGGTIHWTTPKDLSGLSSPVLLDTARKITEAGLAKIGSGLLPKGTLLLSSRAPVGYLAIAEVPLAVNQGYIAMPPGGELSPLFLLFWAQANMDRIKARAGGTTFAEISKKNFRPIPVVVPSDAERERFEVTTGPLVSKMATNEIQSRTLSELRDTLLPKLISGELRVPEAEEHVEDVL